MDHLWTPWRSTYIEETKRGEPGACIFCHAIERPDEENFVLHRGEYAFALLNLYPYSTGHLMVAPYAHVCRLNAVGDEVTSELMRLARLAELVLEEVYKPHGLNAGFNLGEAAGAGIAGHIHLHVLPRWKGDANFMTVIARTRIMPEAIETTYQKVRTGFQRFAELRP
jgi:ATP adenylyltransferase